MITRFCRAKPASVVTRFLKLRTNSKAPTTSSSERATCATTRRRRRPKRSRESVEPRLPAFIAAPGLVAVARIAGTRPKITQAAAATSAMNPNTRASPATSMTIWRLLVPSVATRTRDSDCASTAPAVAPAAAISRLSASSCRTILVREAPSARRTAISRSRTVARASIRLARFAQAISSTSAVMARSSHNGAS